MSNSLILYFFSKIISYLKLFLKFYFLDSLLTLFSFYKNFLNEFERSQGFLIHFKYFFTPLWHIYSLPAYLLSIPIRIIKILIGALCHVLLLTLIFIIYILWLILPWSFTLIQYNLWRILKAF